MFEKKNIMVHLNDPTGCNVELYKEMLKDIIKASGGRIQRLNWIDRECKGQDRYGVWAFVTIRGYKLYDFRRNVTQRIKFENRTGMMNGIGIDLEVLD